LKDLDARETQKPLTTFGRYSHTLALQRLPQREFIKRANEILSGQIKILSLRGQTMT
jgi:hypothetical protein